MSVPNGLAGAGAAGLFQLAFFGLVLPVAAWRSRVRLVRMELPPKKPYFVSVIVQQVVFAGISLAVARAMGLDLFPPVRPTGVQIGVAGLAIATLVAVMRPLWRRQIARRERIAYLVTPTDRTEYGLWALISIAAGIGEEISYRGVFYAAALSLTENPVLAAAVAALAFGAGHLTQGWASALIIVGLALGFHALAAWTGALYVGMAVHAVYDTIAGFAHGWDGRGRSWELPTGAGPGPNDGDGSRDLPTAPSV